MIVSSFLFVIAASRVERGSLLVYWLLKLGYVTAGLAVGMGLSTLCEDSNANGLRPTHGITRGWG